MNRLTDEHSLLRRHKWTLILLSLTILAVLLYGADVPNNPVGFFVDESSIAYNAYTISLTGRDEWGVHWPLFFRAFGEYKNPVYIYLLAALFRLTGPSILVARLLSALIGVLTAFSLGLLAVWISKRRIVGVMVAVMALLTPWLFELSRVAFEVALYPLAVTLFLLCVRRAAEKTTWSLTDVLGLVATLSLLSYSYSIGRLLAPLLALGLVLFATRARLRPLLLTWAGFTLTLVPALVFHARRPGSLTNRFHNITYITPESRYAEIAWDFAKHFALNLNPYRLFVSEHSKVSEIIHIPGAPAMLMATALLAAFGAYLIFKRKPVEAWWRFVFYGLVVSIVPASLTHEYFHMLRLAALPVFVVVLSVPAFAWLVDESAGRVRRGLILAILALMLVQGAAFQRQYHASASSPQRLHLFDADYKSKILPTALATSRPVYIADAPAVPGYIQALWYGTLQRIPPSEFIRLPYDVPAPPGAVVITTEPGCPRCSSLTESEPYSVYVAEGFTRTPGPLPPDGFRAEIRLIDPPARLRSKDKTTVRVVVRNASPVVWYARNRHGEPFQLSLGNHWLNDAGREVIHDDGRAPLLCDVRPGEETELSLTVNAPKQPGNYELEIDMLQEGVTWFGVKGSKPVKLPVRVD
jgi:4-amino-4-deoxy-L-arabinose transferase-like glycosyltransferase